MTDSVLAVAADAAGNSYITGTTASPNFPATKGAFDGFLNGVTDAFVAKFLADGSLAWATYLGGDGDERGHDVTVDADGNVYVLGRTDSADYPTIAGSFDPTFNGGVDAFVTKLNADGATLAYSTYLGGANFEIDQGFDKLARRVGGITVDAAGQAYVTGSTMSGDFPTTSGAFRTVSSGFMDAFVAKLNAKGSALLYSTYLGGNDSDRGHGIAVDAVGNAYVTGEAVSRDFPTGPDSFQPATAGGFSDIFVTKLNATGSALVYSSYLGGTGSEFPGRLALDAAGQAYVTGATASFDFPTTAEAFQPLKAANGTDAFVTKVNASGTGLVYSTHLGGTFGNDFGEAIALDGSGQAYVAGRTNSATFPAANAFQPVRAGLSDAFVTKLNATGSALVYSSYLGGGRNDAAYGIAVDGGNGVHLVGDTISSGEFSTTPFPTTSGAFQPAFGGSGDAFVAWISSKDLPPSLPSLSVTDVSDTEGHSGRKPIQFTLTLSSAGNHAVMVAYATANGTAKARSDYRPTSGTLIIPAGQTTGTITVLVNGDRRGEADETFFVILSAVSNATIFDGNGVGTILDGEPRISIGDSTVVEGSQGQKTLFTFTVTLSTAYDQPVTMSYRTVNSTAKTWNNDYFGKTGTITFRPGQTTKTVTIAVKGDSENEVAETFFVDLFGRSNNSLFTKNRGIGTIVNDD